MSVHFTIQELVRSKKAVELKIDNTPPAAVMPNLLFTMAGAERIRAFLEFPMIISSGYRCPELNKAVGGSENSQHMAGGAIDFTCPGYGDPERIAKVLIPMRFILGIDQMILENNWVHVSFSLTPRYQALRATDGRFEDLT